MAIFKKWSQWAVLAGFILVIFIHYFAATGLIFPNTPAEVTAQYVSLFTPSKLTFYIWLVIYLGAAISISIGFRLREGDALGVYYRQIMTPYFIEWLFYHLLWIILWSYGYVMLALLVVLLYTRTMIRMMTVISGTPALRGSPWQLKYPVGFHTGWLIATSFMTLTVYAVSIGVDATGTMAVWWTLAMMLIALATVAYYYAKYGNVMVMLPVLWMLGGVMLQHRANQVDFDYANPIIFWAALIFLVLGIGATVYLTVLQKKQ